SLDGRLAGATSILRGNVPWPRRATAPAVVEPLSNPEPDGATRGTRARQGQDDLPRAHAPLEFRHPTSNPCAASGNICRAVAAAERLPLRQSCISECSKYSKSVLSKPGP